MNGKIHKILLKALLVIAWVVLYWHLQDISKGLVSLISKAIPALQSQTHLYDALVFFLYDTPKVFMLLVTVVFAVGVIRTFFAPERTRRILAGKGAFTGNILAALLGIVTPFCSCSAIPLFLGFVESGVPLGVTFSFLIAAPMINEVAIILLYGMFGWKVAAIYVGTGLVIAILAGWIIGLLKLEKWVEPWVYQTHMGESGLEEEKHSFVKRINLGYDAVKEIVGKVKTLAFNMIFMSRNEKIHL